MFALKICPVVGLYVKTWHWPVVNKVSGCINCEPVTLKEPDTEIS